MNSSSQFRVNVERNEKLYRLWKEGRTIREASSQADVPEGTVAYYWRKFNRAAAQAKPIPLGSDSEANFNGIETSPIYRILLKSKIVSGIEDLIRAGKADQVKQVVEVMEAVKKLGLDPTPEESRAFNELLFGTRKQKDPRRGVEGPLVVPSSRSPAPERSSGTSVSNKDLNKSSTRTKLETYEFEEIPFKSKRNVRFPQHFTE